MSCRQLCAMLLVAGCAVLANGCASNGGSGNVHGSVYYGAGWHDPYYYNQGMYNDVVVVPNPPDRPDRPVTPPAGQPRPTPLPAAGVAPRPSIPSGPRPGGGGRRR